jgi:ABC-type lipoprotein export system ATPase subunit
MASTALIGSAPAGWVGKLNQPPKLVVCKEYVLGEHKGRALDDVSPAIEEGVFAAIAGPSGSGKSTVLDLIGCIDTPTRGKLIVARHDVAELRYSC